MVLHYSVLFILFIGHGFHHYLGSFPNIFNLLGFRGSDNQEKQNDHNVNVRKDLGRGAANSRTAGSVRDETNHVRHNGQEHGKHITVQTKNDIK